MASGEQRLIDLEVRMNAQNVDLRGLAHQVSSLNEKVDRLFDRLDRLSDKVDGVRTELSGRIERLDQKLDKRVDTLDLKVDRVMAFLVALLIATVSALAAVAFRHWV